MVIQLSKKLEIGWINHFVEEKIRNSKRLDEICWYTLESANNNVNAISFHINKRSNNASGEHSF